MAATSTWWWAPRGGGGHGLWLTMEVIAGDGSARTLRSDRQPLDDAPGELTLTITVTELVHALGAPLPSGPIELRVTLARRLLGPDERAAYALAPQVRLSSTFETRITLDELVRAPLTVAVPAPG